MSLRGRATHVGLCVSDLERSIRFYRDALGFRASGEFPDVHVENEPAATLLRLPGVKLHAVYLERDGLRLELLHYERPGSPAEPPRRAMNDLGFTHLSIRVPDVDRAVAELEAAGATVLRDTLLDLGGTRVAVFVRDPDGLPIELVLGAPS